MLIAFDFLGKGEIRIQGTKIKKMCHTWVARAKDFVKNTLRSSIFKNNIIYTI
jgi:hypothetical protein